MQLISVQLAVRWCVDCQAVQRRGAGGADVRRLPIPQCHTRDEERECSRAGVNGLGYGHADQRTDVTVDLPDIAIVIAARYQEAPSDSNLTTRIVFIEGEFDDWVDTRNFRESLARQTVPFVHVVMPGASHFIAEAAMEVEAVALAFESVGICYRRSSHG